MSNIKDNSEYWAKGLTVAVDRPTLLTESPTHTNKQYYIQAENVFVVVQAPDYIPGSDGGPEVVFANGRIGLLKNLTGDVDLEGALLVANNLSDLANTAAARTNLGLGSLAIKNSVDNNDWAGADLSISNGGTGASDAAGARSNLGLGDLATQSTVDNTDWFGDALEVSNGGTGASDAAGARTNLGLGDLSTKSTINNNDWSGVDLAVSNGGTGASDAPSARTNLGLGDAATKTVQSSSTDTAEGRLMPVGAFGLGGAVTITTIDYDINLLTATGYYALTGAPINGPVGGSLNVHVFGTSLGGGRCWQMAQPHNVGDWYLREQFNGTWRAWKKILNQGDYGIGGDGASTSNLNTLELSGIYSYGGGTTGAPDGNAGVVFHGSRGAQGVFNPSDLQLAMTGAGDVWVRRYSTAWQPWAKIVTAEGNVKDYSGAERRVGWTQGQITFNDGTLSDAYVNNTIRCTTSSGSNTITIPQNLGINTGDLIQIVNVSATPKTIAQASGVGLNWLQGGSISSGNRTLAAYSVATLHKYADNTWYIWGNGIS